MLGTIEYIKEIESDMDGYEVKTNKHIFNILISNSQSCCETWGYFASEDDLNYYIGAILLEVNLVDTELNIEKLEQSGYYEGEGGIQFVNFVTNKGTFQLAVYNAHNGYYGHSILITKDNDIILDSSL